MRETLKRKAHPAFRYQNQINSLKIGLEERSARNHSIGFVKRLKVQRKIQLNKKAQVVHADIRLS